MVGRSDARVPGAGCQVPSARFRFKLKGLACVNGENGKSRSFGARGIVHPTGKLIEPREYTIDEWREVNTSGSGLGWKVVDTVPGKVPSEWNRWALGWHGQMTREMCSVQGGGRTMVINDSNKEDGPVWFELIGISFGCDAVDVWRKGGRGEGGGVSHSAVWAHSEKATPMAKVRMYEFVIPDRRLGHR